VLLIGIERPEAQNRFDAPMLIGLGKAYYRLDHHGPTETPRRVVGNGRNGSRAAVVARLTVRPVCP
jgi:hypothetical protein